MIRSPRSALAVIVAAMAFLLLVASAFLVVQATVVDERLARVMLFAGLTVLVTAVIVGVAFALSRVGGRRMHLH